MLFDTGISSSSEEEEEFEEEEILEYSSEDPEDYLSEESSYETTSSTTTTTTTTASTTTTELPENESEEASDVGFMQMDAITGEMEFPEPSEATFFEEPEEPEQIEGENSDEFSARSVSVSEEAVYESEEEEEE